MTKIVVPTLGESVTEATIAKWLKNVGEVVKADEPIVELETDKVTLEVNAPEDGVIISVIVDEGETVDVGTVLGKMKVGAVVDVAVSAAGGQKEQSGKEAANAKENKSMAVPASATVESIVQNEPKTSPAVRKLLADNNLRASQVPESGKDGRLTKADVEAYLVAKPAVGMLGEDNVSVSVPVEATEPREERVKMSKLRQVIAKRLKEAQDTAAVLTTFNEVDMGSVMALRSEYKDLFEKKHGIKLGFMSFFVKAVVQALKEFPAINSEIDNDEIIFKNFYNIGVAVS
ncbi:MAG: 2-oxo acid dehydrogenase subunit E2, partial [Alphaproteobacteria bacterium]|nr:2-oxo acid dehydrogenase subunit E2 [Alphaproteobacteria bacterium]